MDNIQWPCFYPVGDSTLMVNYGDRIDLQINRRVQALAQILLHNPPPGIGEAIPSYTAVTLHYDPLVIRYRDVLSWVAHCAAWSSEVDLPTARLVEIPTVYGGRYGPDLDFVADHNHLSAQEVIEIHSNVAYPVYMMGFTPGFPYLGGMDARISTPRLPTPRTRVQAWFSGYCRRTDRRLPYRFAWRMADYRLYPSASFFAPDMLPPALLSAGDRVRFIPIEEKDLARVFPGA